MANLVSLAAVTVATIGVLGSVATASLSYYFTKKHEVEMEERRLKQECYKSFIKALSDVAIDNRDHDAQKRLSECFNSLLLIGDAQVLATAMDFHELVRIENTALPRSSAEWIRRHDDLLNALLRAMRHDLFKRKQRGETFPRVHLVGTKPARNAKP